MRVPCLSASTTLRDRRASRHHESERHDNIRRREADFLGPARDETKKSNITHAGIKAFHERRRRGISDQFELDAEALRKCVSDLDDHGPGAMAVDFTGLRVLDELR